MGIQIALVMMGELDDALRIDHEAAGLLRRHAERLVRFFVRVAQKTKGELPLLPEGARSGSRTRTDGDEVRPCLRYVFIGIAQLDHVVDAVATGQRGEKDQHQRPPLPQRGQAHRNAVGGGQLRVRRGSAHGERRITRHRNPPSRRYAAYSPL